MIALLAVALGLAVAQIVEPTEGDFLDGFVGTWRGSVDCPQWLVEDVRPLGGRLGADEAGEFVLPDLILDIEIARQASRLEFQVLKWEAVGRAGGSSLIAWNVISSHSRLPLKGETLHLLATDLDMTVAIRRDGLHAYRYELRNRSLVWEMPGSSLARSESLRVVMRPMRDRFLVLKLFLLEPEPLLIFSIYLVPYQSADTTPTRS